MRHYRQTRWTVYCSMVAIFLAAAGWFFYEWHYTYHEIWIIPGLIMFYLSTFVYFWRKRSPWKVVISDKEIVLKYPFKKTITLLWENIAEIRTLRNPAFGDRIERSEIRAVDGNMYLLPRYSKEFRKDLNKVGTGKGLPIVSANVGKWDWNWNLTVYFLCCFLGLGLGGFGFYLLYLVFELGLDPYMVWVGEAAEIYLRCLIYCSISTVMVVLSLGKLWRYDHCPEFRKSDIRAWQIVKSDLGCLWKEFRKLGAWLNCVIGVGIVSLSIGLIGAVVYGDDNEAFVSFIILNLIVGSGIWCWVTLPTEILVNDIGVEWKYRGGKTITLPWQQIKKIKLTKGPWGGEDTYRFVLTARDGNWYKMPVPPKELCEQIKSFAKEKSVECTVLSLGKWESRLWEVFPWLPLLLGVFFIGLAMFGYFKYLQFMAESIQLRMHGSDAMGLEKVLIFIFVLGLIQLCWGFYTLFKHYWGKKG